MGNKSALQLEVEKEMGFEIDEDLFAYLEHYARRKLEVANKSAGRAWGEDGYGDKYLSLLIPDVIREMAFSAYCDKRSAENPPECRNEKRKRHNGPHKSQDRISRQRTPAHIRNRKRRHGLPGARPSGRF